MIELKNYQILEIRSKRVAFQFAEQLNKKNFPYCLEAIFGGYKLSLGKDKHDKARKGVKIDTTTDMFIEISFGGIKGLNLD